MSYNAVYNQTPRLKAFYNADSATVTYGNVMVWDTSSVYGISDTPPLQHGIYAVMATNTYDGPFPAGVVWSYNTSIY